MAIKNNKIVVISLGGSLIAPPGGVDIFFLKKFRKLIFDFVKKRYKFVIVCGGGDACRKYQVAAKEVAGLSGKDLDWVGIYVTWLHANFVRGLLGGIAGANIITDPTVKLNWNSKVLVAGGWMPGRSTDFDAVKLAQGLGAGTVINISNVDYVYDRDPKITGAKKIEKMNWKDLQKIVGTKWSPGAHVPFDPIATKLGAQLGVVLKFVSGADLLQVSRAIVGDKFKGTIVG